MTEVLLADWLSYLLSNPFCCIIIFIPGLLVPIYRWLKSLLRGG